MNILAIHNSYHIAGGADRCFFELNELLRSQGNDVSLFSRKDSKNIFSSYSKYFAPELDFDLGKRRIRQIKSLMEMFYSVACKRGVERLIKRIRPDLVHLHNIYGRISPSILPILKREKIPIVQTIHDSKYACPNHRMFANGSICEACKGGRYYNAFLKKCSHGSGLFSAVLTLEAYFHRWLNYYDKYIDAFISPSIFMRRKLIEHGMDERKTYYLPNFVNIANVVRNSEPSFEGIYFGNLVVEKGVEVLIRAIARLKSGKFKIIGDGYMRNMFEKMAREIISVNAASIEFMGHLNLDRLREEISNSMMVIVPSIWYENSPMAVLEAFSEGRPVIGSRIGGIPEMIKEGATGLLFDPGDSNGLSEKIWEMLSDRERTVQMGRNAKKWVMENRNPEEYYEKLVGIYNKVRARS